jgi:hypothetical protein
MNSGRYLHALACGALLTLAAPPSARAKARSIFQPAQISIRTGWQGSASSSATK